VVLDGQQRAIESQQCILYIVSNIAGHRVRRQAEAVKSR